MKINGLSAISERNNAISARWRVLLLAVLFAFLAQSFLVQTHRHFKPVSGFTPALAKVDTDGPKQPNPKTPSDPQSGCQICREIAHADQFVLPTPVELEVRALATFWVAVASIPRLTIDRRSHAWQSRAPPHPFQA